MRTPKGIASPSTIPIRDFASPINSSCILMVISPVAPNTTAVPKKRTQASAFFTKSATPVVSIA